MYSCAYFAALPGRYRSPAQGPRMWVIGRSDHIDAPTLSQRSVPGGSCLLAWSASRLCRRLHMGRFIGNDQYQQSFTSGRCPRNQCHARNTPEPDNARRLRPRSCPASRVASSRRSRSTAGERSRSCPAFGATSPTALRAGAGAGTAAPTPGPVPSGNGTGKWRVRSLVGKLLGLVGVSVLSGQRGRGAYPSSSPIFSRPSWTSSAGATAGGEPRWFSPALRPRHRTSKGWNTLRRLHGPL